MAPAGPRWWERRGRDSAPQGCRGRESGYCERQRNEENFNKCCWENTLDLCGRPWTISRQSWDAALLLGHPGHPGRS